MTDELGKECPLMDKICIRESCAWWAERDKSCSIKILAETLDFQAGTVRDILNHM